MTKEDSENSRNPDRIRESDIPSSESMITTAVNFLQNPIVRHKPLQQKQKFLRSKGLTEDEIQIACERSGAFNVDPNSTLISMDLSATHFPQNLQSIQKPSIFTRIKDTLNSIALFGSFAYACYLFYKRYIEPFLFGKIRKKTVDETIKELDVKVEKQIHEVSLEIVRIREEITRNNQNETIASEFSHFKNDLETIKGLLLNRKQFANPIPIVPPSIPAWQLTSQTEPDKNDDAGSGSGSSETEVVTKNSDSSLEIM